MNKIFGIGWAKTGTSSLGECFKILEYNHQGQDLQLVKYIKNNKLQRIMEIAEKKESFEDWPWIILYRELDTNFQDSRFILTIRETDRWIRSYKNMLERQGEASDELNEMRQILYGLPFPDVTASQLANRYDRHNREVKDYFRDRLEDLLIVDWEKGDGWVELCEFLGREVPDVPFPHVNKGVYEKNKYIRRFIDFFTR